MQPAISGPQRVPVPEPGPSEVRQKRSLAIFTGKGAPNMMRLPPTVESESRGTPVHQVCRGLVHECTG